MYRYYFCSATYVSEVWANISDNFTHNISYYHPHYSAMEDSGTTHLSVLAPNGDAVAVTTLVHASMILCYAPLHSPPAALSIHFLVPT